jgi:predicted nucleic acid-binding protein
VTKSDRFVFDTNVLVSAALRRRSLPRQALDHALEHGGLLVSEATVRELRVGNVSKCAKLLADQWAADWRGRRWWERIDRFYPPFTHLAQQEAQREEPDVHRGR